MTCGTPEPSRMPDTVYVLGHLGLGNWFEPQAMLGRMAVRLCNVTAGSTVGRKKLLFAADCSGVWCTNMSQWI